ncbi:MAG: hypothetical protein AAF527_01645, partial [Pseudomonadota bacterium]
PHSLGDGRLSDAMPRPSATMSRAESAFTTPSPVCAAKNAWRPRPASQNRTRRLARFPERLRLRQAGDPIDLRRPLATNPAAPHSPEKTTQPSTPPKGDGEVGDASGRFEGD